jgi:hypothetical protein
MLGALMAAIEPARSTPPELLGRFESGIKEIDRGVQPALKFFSSLFGLTGEWLPDFTFYDDIGVANAQVTDPIVGSSGPLTRPELKIGRNLVGETLRIANGDYNGALTTIFGHEFAHIFQLKSGVRTSLLSADIQSSTRLVEAHADFLAGWALPQAWWITNVSDLAVAAKQFYAMGDLKFEPNAAHGSSSQRQAIMASGYTWGLISPGNAQQAADRGLATLRDLFPQWFTQ